MSDQPDSLVLVYLRRLDERLERLERETTRGFAVISGRMAGLEGRMTALEDWSQDTTERLARIERRLDLAEAPSS